MISRVKTWKVTLENGESVEILAPTRRLALLNYRCEYGYAPIKSIGLLRNR